MNQSEAKRYAHKLVAAAIKGFSPDNGLQKSPDWLKINLAIHEIMEQHLRYGPKVNDAEPQEPQPPQAQDEPLPFD